MLPQMRDDKTQGEEQLALPVENEQRAIPLEKRSEPTATSPRRWIRVLLSILGILLPLAGGFLAGWPWYQFGYEGDFLPPSVFFGVILLVVVGAAFLRSWWAVLIVPLVFTVASMLTGNILQHLLFGWDCTLLSNVVCPGVYGPGWSAVGAWLGSKPFWDGLDFDLFLFMPLYACVAALGAWGGISLSNGRRNSGNNHE